MTLGDAQSRGYELTEKDIKQLEKHIIQDYQESYNIIKAKLKKTYLKLTGIKPEDYYTEIAKYNRLTQLLDDIAKAYKTQALKAGKTQIESSKLAINNAYYRALYTVSWTEPVNGLFVVLPPEIVDISVFGTPEVWKGIKRKALEKLWGTLGAYQPQHGTLTETLVKNRIGDLERIRQTVTRALIQGESFQKAARAVREVINTSTNNAMRISRTEGHRNMQAGNYANTQALTNKYGIDIRRQIVATLDTKTRPQSARMDGQKEDKNGYFTYPGGRKVAIPGNSGVPKWDINDRESVISLVDGYEPTVRRGRDPVTGKSDIIAYTSFDAWMKKNRLKYNKAGRMVHVDK